MACVLASAFGAVPAAAAPPPLAATVAVAGTCVALPGSLHMTFTPGMSTSNLNPIVSIDGTLTCFGTPLQGILSVGVQGDAIAYSCAGGLVFPSGTLGYPSDGYDLVSGMAVGSGTTVALELIGNRGEIAGEFAWSTVGAINACDLGTVTVTDLVGSATYEAG